MADATADINGMVMGSVPKFYLVVLGITVIYFHEEEMKVIWTTGKMTREVPWRMGGVRHGPVSMLNFRLITVSRSNHEKKG